MRRFLDFLYDAAAWAAALCMVGVKQRWRMGWVQLGTARV